MDKLGKILKIVLIVAIVAVILLLAINMFKSSHRELENIIITDELRNAYASTSDIRTHKPADDGFSPNGGLYAYSLAYIESEGYLQVTIRYNERHMDDIAERYPTFDRTAISYTLTDENGKTYTPRVLEKEEKFHYQYRRLEFTGVDFSAKQLTLNMIIDEIADVVKDQSSVVLHKKDEQSLPWSLSADERTKLSVEIATK